MERAALHNSDSIMTPNIPKKKKRERELGFLKKRKRIKNIHCSIYMKQFVFLQNNVGHQMFPKEN